MTSSGWRGRALCTPGPLTTSRTVKQMMLRDLGLRDHEFIVVVADVRRRLVEVAAADPDVPCASWQKWASRRNH